MNKISINNRIQDSDIKNDSMFKSNFRYSLSVFEALNVFKIDNSFKIFRLEDHLNRLKNSARHLNFNIEISLKQISNNIEDLISSNKINDSFTVRIFIYNDSFKFEDVNPSIVMYCLPYKICDKNYSLKTANTFKPFDSIMPAKIKCTSNYTRNYIQTQRLKSEYDDILNYNINNYVLETSRANIFFLKNNEIITPCSKLDILEGITRKTVIDIIKSIGNLEIHEKKINIDEIGYYDSAFLTSTSIGIKRINNINKSYFNINNPIIDKIKNEYRNYTINAGEHSNSIIIY